MKLSTFLPGCIALALFSCAALTARAQDAKPPDAKPAEDKAPDPKPAAKSKSAPVYRLTIVVKGGEKNLPVENASVYLKYYEEHAIKKNKVVELNVKTNQDGTAHIPEPQLGRVLIQVIAEGWKSYGRWYDLTDAKQTIEIQLQRPPKWY
jgi:hypothetical protein